MTRDDADASHVGSTPHRSTRHTVALLLLAGTVVTATVIGVIGLILGAPAAQHARSSPATVALPLTTSPTTRTTESPSCSPNGVRALAVSLFDWDAGTGTRQQTLRRIVRLADPSGVETPGLLLDLDGYLPTEDAWTVLAGYRTRQTITHLHVRIPDTWAAIAKANVTQLPVGTATFTIDAERHRSGDVDGAPSSSTSGLTFTMIVRCPPGGAGWRLLRLSRPGEPLP